MLPPHTHKNLLHPFSHLPFEHFLLKPASSCFYHCHNWAVRATCFPGECRRWEILETLAAYVAPDFFFIIICMEIYVYILNSVSIVIEHYATWGLCWFCSDRVICCHKWTHCLQWFHSQLATGLPSPPLLVIDLWNCVSGSTPSVRLSFHCGLCVSEWRWQNSLGKRLSGFYESSLCL